ncbi:nitronate monooxygenase [Kocuria atrinae]|uniref:nitronate monooxygenase n=1 Tax=Kocuria atrinae TaxID=592377 RepID=UPI0021D44D47|nr:nitronate monooxygenase [Kocuria atrinae]
MLDTLCVPLIQAPMAGGPSNAALAVAVSQAGGLGMLAAGYKTVEAMAAEIDDVRAGTLNFGVNLFVPEADPSDPEALDAYATALAPMAAELGIERPSQARSTMISTPPRLITSWPTRSRSFRSRSVCPPPTTSLACGPWAPR